MSFPVLKLPEFSPVKMEQTVKMFEDAIAYLSTTFRSCFRFRVLNRFGICIESTGGGPLLKLPVLGAEDEASACHK